MMNAKLRFFAKKEKLVMKKCSYCRLSLFVWIASFLPMTIPVDRHCELAKQSVLSVISSVVEKSVPPFSHCEPLQRQGCRRYISPLRHCEPAKQSRICCISIDCFTAFAMTAACRDVARRVSTIIHKDCLAP